MHAPEIPSGRLKWECPGCNYVIDFLDLTEKDIERFLDDQAKSLRQKSWQYLDEDKMKWAVQRMISSHYDAHMRQNGVRVKWDKNKVRPG